MADQELATILNSGGITSVYLGGTGTDDKLLKKSEIDSGYTTTAEQTAIEDRVTANEADIVVLQTPPDAAQLNPVAVAPTHVAGQFYYSSISGTFQIQGPYPGIETAPGHGEHVHVVNNSGAIIPAGAACRFNGVAGGIPQIELAIADSFTNARVQGVASIDIAIGAESAIVKSGLIANLDTAGLPVGTPLYLSDTVAGTYTSTQPAIKTVVGGVLVADALVGQLNLDIQVNQNTPTVFGVLQGQTTPTSGIYPLTVVPTTIIDYATEDSIVTGVNAATGELTLPNDGTYELKFTANLSFPSLASTRSITVQLYDVTGAVVHFPYDKSIPRDATSDSLSFSWVLPNEVVGRVHTIRMLSADNFTITISEVSYSITSIVIT